MATHTTMNPSSDHHKDPTLLPNKEKPLIQLIKQEDDNNKFFARLLSKEVAIVNNSSFRVYYGGVVGAVPFTWEAQPGTPKHALMFSDDERGLSLPPLTPPPSSFSSTASNSKEKEEPDAKNDNAVVTRSQPGFLRRLLTKIRAGRPSMLLQVMAGSPSNSSISSGFVPVKPLDYRRGRRRFSSRGSFDSITYPMGLDDEDEKERIGSRIGLGSCFGFHGRKKVGPRGCYGW